MVVFSYTVSDFGIPKVIGGNFNVLARRHLQAGDRPAELQQGRCRRPAPAFARACSRSSSTGSCRAGCRRSSPRAPSPTRPKRIVVVRPDDVRRTACVVALLLLAVLGMAVYTSFIKFWPYDKSFSLRHYTFGLIDAGVIVSFFNSLKMAAAVGVLRHDLHFRRRLPARKDARHAAGSSRRCGCWRRCRWPCRAWCWAWATSCSSIDPANPLNGLYGTR